MHAVLHFHREEEDGVGTAVLFFHRHIADVGVVFGDGRGHFGKHAALVTHDNFDQDVEHVARFGLPFDVQPLVWIGAERTNRRAVMGVNNEAAILVDEPENGIAGNRVATLRQLDRDAFGATNADGMRVGWLARFLAQHMKQLVRDHQRQFSSQTDASE